MTGLTITEIAEELGIDEWTAEKRLRKAGVKIICRKALYPLDAADCIREVAPVGRPRKVIEEAFNKAEIAQDEFFSAARIGDLREMDDKKLLYEKYLMEIDAILSIENEFNSDTTKDDNARFNSLKYGKKLKDAHMEYIEAKKTGDLQATNDKWIMYAQLLKEGFASLERITNITPNDFFNKLSDINKDKKNNFDEMMRWIENNLQTKTDAIMYSLDNGRPPKPKKDK